MISSAMSSPRRLTDHTMFLEEGGFVFRNIHDESGRVKAYRLRHRVFAEDLRWVPQTESELEVDAYDARAVHFGVFDQQDNLVAYVRLLTSEHVFMLERELLCVIGGDRTIRKDHSTAELTRLCVDPQTRGNLISCQVGRLNSFMLLFKGVYQWCISREIRYLYAVTDRMVHKMVTIKGFPYAKIGGPTTMPDGVVAVAVMLDWREFETMNSVKRPELLQWYAQKSMSLLSSAMAIA